jgi:DNA-binding beta-propeller fold protein YncE
VTDSETPPVTVTQAESITVTGGVTGGTFPVGSGPDGIAFDGTNMWVANSNDNTVTELPPAG